MISQIELGGIVLEVVKKDIKNIHLSVIRHRVEFEFLRHGK